MDLNDLMNSPTMVTDNMAIMGPAGVDTSPGYVDVSCSVSDPTSSTTFTNNIAVIEKAITRGTAAFKQSGAKQIVTITEDPGGNCYWLPWGSGKVFMGLVGQSCAHFFTYTINGCGVIIGGTPTKPIVAHANLKSKRLDDVAEAASKHPDIMIGGAMLAEGQALIYEQFYGSLAAELINTGRMSGAKLTVIAPREYLLESGASFGAIFGIRKGANWEFYGNWAKKTRKIWPR